MILRDVNLVLTRNGLYSPWEWEDKVAKVPDHEKYSTYGDPDPECVNVCVEWLLTYAKETKSIRPQTSSYTMKHIVEQSEKRYIANGDFIAAALKLGYKMQRNTYGSLNCRFNFTYPKEFR